MAVYHRPDSRKIQALKDIANKLRIHSIQATQASGSGHPTSCCSAAEIMSVLFFQSMRYSVSEPRGPANDRFILSKGHAAPVLYAAWAETGLFPASDLLNLRKIDSDLEGHPTPRLNFIDVATGSLGQGLSVAAGMAYTGKYFDKADYRVYCMIGDGESMEGSIWEAMAFASLYKLDNLVAIFDVNRLGQSEEAPLQHDMDTYQRRAEAFGFHTIVVDGHEVDALCKAFHDAEQTKGKPTCIVAKTFKGKGCQPEIEDHLNWHGKALGAKGEDAIKLISSRIANQGPHGLYPSVPNPVRDVDISNIQLDSPPNYKIGDKVAVRAAYGTAIAKLARNNPNVIALDGDTKNSTYSEKIKTVDSSRHVECFIAEQNLVGVAIGCAARDRTVAFASTFAAFFTRAFDQLRMGAVSQTNINLVGSHAGISIGEDGPSQMALEDLGMFRSIPGSTVFYPTDAVSGERAVELAANTKGICFIRTSRPALPVLYNSDEKFEIGKAKIVRKSSNDKVTIIGSCVTLYEALTAAEELAQSGTNVRVIDPFTIKPLDAETIIASARETNNQIITVEDHYPEGGIGEAVSAAVSKEPGIVVTSLAVRSIPRSGKPNELLDMFGISAPHIIKAVKDLAI